jgi:hypothetical protein
MAGNFFYLASAQRQKVVTVRNAAHIKAFRKGQGIDTDLAKRALQQPVTVTLT